MKIFVDFDDVLFNTRAFMRDLVAACAPFGVTPAQWHAAYRDRAGDVPGVHAPFTIVRFAPILARAVGGDATVLAQAMEEATMRNLQKYVFADSVAFLRYFSRDDVFILTYGDDTFQRARVVGCGLGALVAETFVTQAQKVEVLVDYLDAHPTVMPTEMVYLDDRAVYFGPVKAQLPAVRTVLVMRPERRYNDAPTAACDCAVQDLVNPRVAVECDT